MCWPLKSCEENVHKKYWYNFLNIEIAEPRFFCFLFFRQFSILEMHHLCSGANLVLRWNRRWYSIASLSVSRFAMCVCSFIRQPGLKRQVAGVHCASGNNWIVYLCACNFPVAHDSVTEHISGPQQMRVYFICLEQMSIIRDYFSIGAFIPSLFLCLDFLHLRVPFMNGLYVCVCVCAVASTLAIHIENVKTSSKIRRLCMAFDKWPLL